MNASKTKTEDSEDFEVDINEGIASEIRDDLRALEANQANQTAKEIDDSDAARFAKFATTFFVNGIGTEGCQLPEHLLTGEETEISFSSARANYWRWRQIATDAMRQYRYAAAALGRELRSAQEQNRRKAAAESSDRPRHRSDTGAGESAET